METLRPLVLTYLENDPKGDRWALVHPITFYTIRGRITVPSGYITDFASSPPWLWSVIPPIGRNNRDFMLHDFWYDNRLFETELGPRVARKQADDELYRRLRQTAPHRWLRNGCIYYACRWFGRSWWVN